MALYYYRSSKDATVPLKPPKYATSGEGGGWHGNKVGPMELEGAAVVATMAAAHRDLNYGVSQPGKVRATDRPLQQAKGRRNLMAATANFPIVPTSSCVYERSLDLTLPLTAAADSEPWIRSYRLMAGAGPVGSRLMASQPAG